MTRSAGLNLQGRARTVAAATLPALVALAASASPGCSDGATDTKCEPRRECDPQKLASQQDDGCGGILECPSTRGAIASLALQTQMAARLEIPLENVQKRFIRFTRPPVHGTAAVGADRIVFEPGPEISGTDSMRIAFWTDAAKTRQIEVTYKIDILDKTCTSATFGGPTDGLLLHIPQNYLSSDISQSGHRVQIISEPNTDIPGKEIRPSRTDFENRSIRVDLAPASDTARTISFRSIPGAVLSDRPAMTFEGGAAIALYDSTEQASGLRPHECNQHVAIIRDGQMESWVNGIFAVRPASGQAGGPLTIGPILSKLWDFRIYDRALAPGEIEELSERCTTVKPKFPDLPKATCGVYHCTHYKPFDPAKTTDDHVIYYRTRREESTEWGFLGNALWPHQQYCDFVQNGYGADDELDPSKEATYVNYDELSPITPDSIFERHEWAHWEYGRLFDGQAGSFGCSLFMTETYGPFSAEQVRRGHRDTLIGGLPLVPHAPLWMNREEASGFDGSETPDLMDAHLQAGHTFFTHVSDQLQQSQFMGYLFNSQRCRTEPIAFLRDYFSAKGVDIRNIYSDYASRIATHDLPLGELYRDMEFETFKQLACVNSNVDFRFTTSINRTPPMGWINLQEGRVPGAFAYNLYRIVNTAPGGYNISLDKLTARNRLLVTAVTTDSKDESRKFSCKGTEREYLQPKMTRRRYQTMVVEGDQRESTMTVRTEEGETMFVVVATLPDVYSGYERFPHAIRFELAP